VIEKITSNHSSTAIVLPTLSPCKFGEDRLGIDAKIIGLTESVKTNKLKKTNEKQKQKVSPPSDTVAAAGPAENEWRGSNW